MSDEKRPYRMTARAELEKQTRLKIVQSAVALHGSVGPARTTIGALAERAGVRRSTVYRHFPDEAALFAACSAHWAAGDPLPNFTMWAEISNCEKRLARALGELYPHYERNEQMMTNILRDEAAMPVITPHLNHYREYLLGARVVLMEGRSETGAGRLLAEAAIGHALAFHTWRSLAREQKLRLYDALHLVLLLVWNASSSDRLEARLP